MKITTRIASQNPRHTVIDVWQDGGKAGSLAVETEVADEMVARLMGTVNKDLLAVAEIVVEEADQFMSSRLLNAAETALAAEGGAE